MWLYLALLGGISLLEWGPVLLGMVLHRHGLPMYSPMFDPAGRFADWTIFLERARHFGQPGVISRTDLGYPFTYPLPCFFVYVLFVRLFAHSVRAYLIAGGVIFVGATAAYSVGLARRGAGWLMQAVVWATLLLGLPALFLLDRGNIEVFLWLFMLLGTVSFVYKRPYLAASCFGIAAAMKVYPALLLLLLLRRRQYRAFAAGVVVAVGLTLLAAQAIGPSIAGALHDLSAGAYALNQTQMKTIFEAVLRFDHSLFGLAKQSFHIPQLALHRDLGEARFLSRLALGYSVFAPLLFVGLYWFRIRQMPLLNQFCALIFLALLLPFFSYEYTLVHAYLCLGVLLIYFTEFRADRRLVTQLLGCFALLFAPLARLTAHHFQGQVKCLALVALLWLVVKNPMPSRLFDDLPA